MRGAFVELHLDEDVDVLVAELIRARGFVVTTARDVGQLSKSDQEQLAHAVTQRKALLTHNRTDFEKIAQEYFATGRTHNGIILSARRSPYEIARRLLLLLNHVTPDEMKNQVRYI